jgi:RNA polymerase sigma-70 factor (ECF subfamily)
MIRIVQDPKHPEHAPATNRLLLRYWKPVFRFLRRKGVSTHDAEDLVQEFFTDFLTTDAVERADPKRGRFRNFILAVLKHHVSDLCNPKRIRKQKAFERGFVSFSRLVEEEEQTFDPVADETPEDAFNRQWAQDVWQTVLNRLRDHYSDDEEGRIQYEIFLAHWTASDEAPSAAELGAIYNRPCETVYQYQRTMKNRFARLLNIEVSERIGPEADLEDELRELQRWLLTGKNSRLARSQK